MKPHYKRHSRDEYVDEVRMEIVPRYKTSGLSGDEWRTSARTVLYRKGAEVKSRTYQSIEDAAAHLPWLLKTWGEEANDEEHAAMQRRIDRDRITCHQPGCAEPSVVTYSLKTEYSREGYERLVNPERPIYRAFCKKHSTRGDCGLEDADVNYTLVET